MNEKLFRKSGIDRVNSPEQLNEYIRVANPAVWLVLAAVGFLLLGVLIWGVFGSVETKVDAGVVVKNQTAVCYVSAQYAAQMQPGMTVTIGDVTGSIQSVDTTPLSVAVLSDYLRYLTGFAQEDFCCAATLDVQGVSEGEYAAIVTLSSQRPISFVIH